MLENIVLNLLIEKDDMLFLFEIQNRLKYYGIEMGSYELMDVLKNAGFIVDINLKDVEFTKVSC